MADDPPPPPQHFSSKNEKMGVLTRRAEQGLAEEVFPAPPWVPAPAPRFEYSDIAVPQLDNRSLFIGAMRDPSRRSIAFNVVERNCRERFAEGEGGIKLYIQLLGYVRFANVREAVDEFERRFVPMLDQELLKKKMKEAR
jgi:hypothetical protein